MLALASCIREDLTPAVTSDGDNIVLDFGIVVPEAQTATKSISAPAITSLTVVAFDEYGYFVAAADASPVNGWDVSSATETEFTVSLPQSASARKLHFIANGPAANTFSYGAETDIMTGLVSEGGNDAYWQTLQVSSLLVQDQSSLNEAMQSIPMIRNYAKVRIGTVAGSFTLTGYALINVPTSGTMVPYNMDSGSFQDYEDDGVGKEYTALKTAGYSGFMPENVGFAVNVADNLANINWITGTAGAYTYESSADCETALLVRGKYSGSQTETYYKVAIYDEACGIHDILRNIEYVVNITNVAGAGYATAIEAAKSVAGNNISVSTSTKNLLNISDGTQRLYVEYTAKRVVSTDPFTLKYKFLPSSTSSAVNKQHPVGGTPSAGEPITITRKTTSEDGTAVIDTMTGDGSSVDGDGFSTLTITPQSTLPNGSDVWSEEITIKSTYNNVVLSRTVTLYMLNPYVMSVSCSPKIVEAAMGKDVLVNINLPLTLPPEVFPLVFDLEADAMSLYPNTTATATDILGQPISMPVVSGTSIIPNKASGSSTFHFQRTLSKEEYDALVTNTSNSTVAVPCYFRTNVAANAATVHVYNEYFNPASDFFINEDSNLIDGGYYGAGNEVKLVFLASEAGEYTISSNTLVTKAVNYTETLAANQVYEKSLYTADWATKVTVSVDGPVDYSLEGETRNKLAMKAKSIIVNGAEYTGYTTYGVYMSEADAKALTNSIGAAVSTDMKSNAGSLLVKENLDQTTKLFFSYTYGSNVYVANAEAKALHEGAVLTFTQYEMPLSMQVEFGDGADRYGSGQAFTLTFTTNKTGTYVINSMNFAIENVSTNAEFEMTAGVPVTVNCTSTTWSDKATITIQCNETVTGENSQTFTGPDRNKLYIKPSSVTASTGNSLQDVKMSTTTITSNNWSNVSTIATFSLDELRAGVEVEINNLNSTTTYYFAYRYGNGGNRTYRYESMTAENLANGTAMSFGSSY